MPGLKKTKKNKSWKQKKNPRRNHCAVSRKKPRKRPHFLQLNMNLRFCFICVQYLFSIFGFSLLTSAYFSGIKLSFSQMLKIPKFINVFVFIKGKIPWSVVVVVQNNFASMCHKNHIVKYRTNNIHFAHRT